MRHCHLLFVLLSVGCQKQPSAPAVQYRPSTASVTERGGTLPVVVPNQAFFLSAGFCAEDKTIAHINSISLPDGRRLYELNCAMYAYQGRYEYAWGDATPVLNQLEKPMSLVGLPYRDTGVIELKWTEKARGSGDCGDWFWYAFSGDRFRLKEHRRRHCSTGIEVSAEMVDGSKWPLIEVDGL